jgi:plastocyanin
MPRLTVLGWIWSVVARSNARACRWIASQVTTALPLKVCRLCNFNCTFAAVGSLFLPNRPAMKIFPWHLLLVVATAVSLIAYPKRASAATFNVTVGPGGNLVFMPSSVTIHPGDQVKWTWDSSGHTTTSGSPGMPTGMWNSGLRNQGATFTRTFTSTGMFPYYCTPHGGCCGMVGTVRVVSATPTPTPPPPTPAAGTATVADFNRDGHPDLVLRNAVTRQTVIWRLNNNLFISSAVGPTLPAGWGLRGARDFNIDTRPDYALFNPATRQTAIWYLSGVSGSTFAGSAAGPTPPSGWAVVAVADFNGNGKPDYVLYNAATRKTVIWYLNNNVFVSSAVGPILPAGWSLVGQ